MTSGCGAIVSAALLVVSQEVPVKASERLSALFCVFTPFRGRDCLFWWDFCRRFSADWTLTQEKASGNKLTLATVGLQAPEMTESSPWCNKWSSIKLFLSTHGVHLFGISVTHRQARPSWGCIASSSLQLLVLALTAFCSFCFLSSSPGQHVWRLGAVSLLFN